MVHWYSFGECSCPAHTIMDVRFESQSEDFSPMCPVAICPDCALELKFRASWPATSDGFGGSSGLMEELVARAKRIADKYGAEFPDVANLGVVVDALEAQRKVRPEPEMEEPRPTLDNIAEMMKYNGLPTAYVSRVAELARQKEVAADLVHLWHEAADEEERAAIEFDLFRILNAGLSFSEQREVYAKIESEIRAAPSSDMASLRCGLPISVIERMQRRMEALAYMGALT